MTHSDTIEVAVAGAAGRMGRRLCALAGETDGLTLAEAFEAPGHAAIGEAASESDVAIADHFQGQADVLIDFTVPQATRANLDRCVELGKPIVIGTTGFSDDDEAAIDTAAERIPLVQAANFSLVVNVLTKLAAQAAAMLGDSYDIEIVETHHRFKKDAPSGTALAIARALCEATGRDAKQDVRLERAGDDVPRAKNEITVQALRLGDVVGEHTVMFGAPGERMELRHIGTSRDSYATGALHAAKWLAGKPAGRYTMADVLGLGD